MTSVAVSKANATQAGERIIKFANDILASNDLVRGRTKISYGDKFVIKIEAHPKTDGEQVSSQLCRALSNPIADFAKAMFGEYQLQIKSVSSKYGNLYSINITAEPVELGKNGVNLASEIAQNWRYSNWRYNTNQVDAEAALGEPAMIGNKTYIFMGLKVGRKEIKIVAKTPDGTEYLMPERYITHWGFDAPKVMSA